MPRKTYSIPQFKGLKSGAGGTPAAPLEYIEVAAGSPASSKRPTTMEPAGDTMVKMPTRQSHSTRKMTDGNKP